MNSYDRDTRDPYSFKATHTFSPSIKDYGDNQKDIHYSYKEKRWSKDKLKDSPRKDVYYNAHTHTHTHTHAHAGKSGKFRGINKPHTHMNNNNYTHTHTHTHKHTK
eukprot:GHVR01005231.1.p1 GENE.GHVR01005231.1~~GHVR01005231.1.p1  ORF type:complete len:113 (-),score=75.94 GHVR01005231.1:166-483(-)